MAQDGTGNIDITHVCTHTQEEDLAVIVNSPVPVVPPVPVKRRRGLLVDQHHNLGVELTRMDRMLARMQVEVSTVYGNTQTEAKQLAKARKALLTLRSELESRYCREYPTRVDCCHVYFGSVGDRLAMQIVAKIPSSL